MGGLEVSVWALSTRCPECGSHLAWLLGHCHRHHPHPPPPPPIPHPRHFSASQPPPPPTHTGPRLAHGVLAPSGSSQPTSHTVPALVTVTVTLSTLPPPACRPQHRADSSVGRCQLQGTPIPVLVPPTSTSRTRCGGFVHPLLQAQWLLGAHKPPGLQKKGSTQATARRQARGRADGRMRQTLRSWVGVPHLEALSQGSPWVSPRPKGRALTLFCAPRRRCWRWGERWHRSESGSGRPRQSLDGREGAEGTGRRGLGRGGAWQPGPRGPTAEGEAR